MQRYGEPLDPCWLYIVLPSGYRHFAYFSNDVPEAAEHASLYPDPYLGALFTAASGRRAVFRPTGEKHPGSSRRSYRAGTGAYAQPTTSNSSHTPTST